MSFITADDLKRRAQLQATIDKMDNERGRPLTVSERLANLRNALNHCFTCDAPVEPHTEQCPHCGQLLM